MAKLNSWFRLVRIAALPTALADVWLGGAVANASVNALVDVSIISLFLYSAGMILNDAHDVKGDRVHNPNRPLPMGEISVRAATLVGFGLIAFALLLGLSTLRQGIAVFVITALLSLLILTYNFIAKSTIVGPLNMGLCRAFNVLLGVSAAGKLIRDNSFLILAVAVPIFVYVVGVTWLSRNEAEPNARRSKAAMAVIILGLLLIPALHWVNEWYIAEKFLLAQLVTVAAFILSTLAFSVLIRRGESVRESVGAALALIIPFEALVAAASLRPPAALLILALIAPVWLLRRLSHLT